MILFSHLLLFILPSLIATASIFEQSQNARCVPITLPLCRDIQYNETVYPSVLSPMEQGQIEHFKPLFKTKCHPHIKLFLCSVFVPMCPSQMPQAVYPCRSVCEQVKRDCLALLTEFDLKWPELLECSQFPEKDKGLCMSTSGEKGIGRSPPRIVSGVSTERGNPLSFQCPKFLIDTDTDDEQSLCALPCNTNVFFTAEHKKLFSKWLPIISSFCAVLSTLTFLTYLVDRSRFPYPEKCIFFISLCYLLYSLPFLYSLLDSSTPIACHRPITHSNVDSHLSLNEDYSLLCTLSFIFTYYFSLASIVWWLMFSFTWYLSACRKWVPEGLDAISFRLHVIGWFGPLLGTIAVLATHSVDSSEMTGLCGVGNSNSQSLLFYSIIPRSIIGGMAVVFLIASLSSMCRERNNFRRRGTDTSKLDRLMLKTCLFSLLQVVPWLAFVGGDVYHFTQLLSWQETTFGCKRFPDKQCLHSAPILNGEVYLVQLLLSLGAFIGPFIWIFSTKTLHSWQHSVCCCLWPAPSKSSSRSLLDPPVPLPQAPPPRGIPHQYLPLSTTSNTRWAHNHL